MPVYLRNFYYKELIDIKKSEKDQVEKQQKSDVHRPNIPNRNFKR